MLLTTTQKRVKVKLFNWQMIYSFKFKWNWFDLFKLSLHGQPFTSIIIFAVGPRIKFGWRTSFNRESIWRNRIFKSRWFGRRVKICQQQAVKWFPPYSAKWLRLSPLYKRKLLMPIWQLSQSCCRCHRRHMSPVSFSSGALTLYNIAISNSFAITFSCWITATAAAAPFLFLFLLFALNLLFISSRVHPWPSPPSFE